MNKKLILCLFIVPCLNAHSEEPTIGKQTIYPKRPDDLEQALKQANIYYEQLSKKMEPLYNLPGIAKTAIVSGTLGALGGAVGMKAFKISAFGAIAVASLAYLQNHLDNGPHSLNFGENTFKNNPTNPHVDPIINQDKVEENQKE